METKLKSKLKGIELIKLEKELFDYKGEDKIISSEEMAEILKKESISNFSFSTGIKAMDNILDNVESGELVIITGPTGSGKTSLMLTITRNTALLGIKSVWFNFELTLRQFFMKFDYNPPLFYLPQQNSDNNIYWLEERILESVVKYNVKMVFIDDLHHIFSLAKIQNNTSLEIGDIMAKLKDIAVVNNLIIYIQVHIKDPQEGVSREPVIRDIRDSGLIKAFADTVIGIWRVPNSTLTVKGKRERLQELFEEDIKAKVAVWKNRRKGILSHFYLAMENNFFKEKYDKHGYQIN